MSEPMADNDTSSHQLTGRDAGATLPHQAVITDVWSWTARKYRVRARVLLLLNLLLFCGLCMFTRWLHVARILDFSVESYMGPLRFWGTDTQTLYDFILFPISVDQTPIYGVVIGLLMASVVAIPICVAILYRFKSSLPFAAAVLVFAHLPWLAITLVGSCVLASVRPFRMEFRFGSALLGMLPVLLYLFLATRGPGDPLSASISPERKLLLAGPWLLAILAACSMMAAIILIARIVNHRPGAVAPVMAIMFATPVVLFHFHVGVDELHYRVLESEYGPRSERFEPVQDASGRILGMLHRWTQPGSDSASLHSAFLAIWSTNPAEQVALKARLTRRLLHDFQIQLMRDRHAAYNACQVFVADHPHSRYVPNALFIQARALDTRLDQRRLVGREAQRELYTDFPHVESLQVWTNLLAEYPDSPLAVSARLRVAQLRLRGGDEVAALRVLQPMASAEAISPDPPPARPFMQTQPPESSLAYEPEPDLLESRRLAELIRVNRDDPKHGAEPLRALASLDPHRASYRDQLQRLADRYHDSLLYDNIVVRWAEAHADREERARKLAACIERFPTGDALPEALFKLANLEVQAPGADESCRVRGIGRLRRIVEHFGQSCWAQPGAERLKMLGPQSQPTTHTAEVP